MSNTTLNTLNKTIVANKAKINSLKVKNNDIVNQAITMVNNKIEEIKNNVEYKATERKAIKIIQVELFQPKNKEDKLSNELKQAIKAVVVSHKRKVHDNISWDTLSVSKINEMLAHMDVKEIKDNQDIESINSCLNDKKTRTVTTLAYEKASK